ncbi:PHD finger protein ALFIN-LIKE 3-like [Salvia splendens]|uniref:PHD finger protein ALFIN-LIKE 3-like n=1 Tax=Salvia splendens TaxID=180675 RepID=UPI001C267172|nr:PHD finger protein ALFIN-LIKE 3-like [Salvia splendens]
MDGFGPDNYRTVWEVFGDYNGRRMALIKALTIDAKEFIRQCDPDKANLCLFGLPNGQWKIDLPPEKVPPDLPEPALGINFARDGMQEKDWLAYVAIHSDAWLLSLASYFGARCYFDKTDRKCLFDMINDLPTVLEVVIQYAKHKQQAISLERMSGHQPNDEAKYEGSNEEDEGSDEEDEGSDEEDEDGYEETTLCGSCGEYYTSDEFWITCDLCQIWFHGRCVNITFAEAEHITQFKCPTCTDKRARP